MKKGSRKSNPETLWEINKSEETGEEKKNHETP